MQANFSLGPKIPFWVNDIDATVVANALFSTCSLLLHRDDLLPDYPKEVLNLMLSNAKLLEFVLRKGLVLSPHSFLVLLYYPSKTIFYWYVARIAHTLNSSKLRSKVSSADVRLVLKRIRKILTRALRTYGTKQLLDLGKSRGSYYFWDEFIGNGDHPFPTYEDRVFSTAVACNALLDIWTIRRTQEGGGRHGLAWVKGTPEHVKEVVEGKGYQQTKDDGLCAWYCLFIQLCFHVGLLAQFRLRSINAFRLLARTVHETCKVASSKIWMGARAFGPRDTFLRLLFYYGAGAVAWLIEKSEHFPKENAFFYGEFKGLDSLELFYPHYPDNFMSLMSPSGPQPISCDDSSTDFSTRVLRIRTGVQGVRLRKSARDLLFVIATWVFNDMINFDSLFINIFLFCFCVYQYVPPDAYAKLLEQECLGRPVPTADRVTQGYNCKGTTTNSTLTFFRN